MNTPPQMDWEYLLRQAPDIHPPPGLSHRVQEHLQDFHCRSRRILWYWAWAYLLALASCGLPWLFLTWLVFPPAAQAWVRRLVLWQWAIPMLGEILREGLGTAWWTPLLVLALLTIIGLYMWSRWMVRWWARQRWTEAPNPLQSLH